MCVYIYIFVYLCVDMFSDKAIQLDAFNTQMALLSNPLEKVDVCL